MAPKNKRVKTPVGKARKVSGAKRTIAKKAAKPTTSSARRGGKITSGEARPLIGPRTEYRIYPSIGIARIGNSTKGYFIGPETPGVAPEGPYRDETGIRPQAARFRIYTVTIDENGNETIGEEVQARNGVEISWTVSLANRKAAAKEIYGRDGTGTLSRNPKPNNRNSGYMRNPLVIEAATTITKSDADEVLTLAGSIRFVKEGGTSAEAEADDIKLADLRYEKDGRLLVIGGPGTSGTPFRKPDGTRVDLPTFSDNDGWYDSISDGPVAATIRINGQSEIAAVPAWVIVTVPRYAPEIYGIVTWYDQAVNMAHTEPTTGSLQLPRSTSFKQDILPILERTDSLAAVHDVAHGNNMNRLASPERLEALANSLDLRKEFYARLTQPNAKAPGGNQLPRGTMPKLFSGGNPDSSSDTPTWTFLSLTPYQHEHLKNWVNGNLREEPSHSVTSPAMNLTRAALESCVGGSFFPGIEATYDIARVSAYHPLENLRKEFRINPAFEPGSLTEKMALPWQADFAECGQFWWPSQRPVATRTSSNTFLNWDRGIWDTVTTKDAAHKNMVDHWDKLAHVLKNETGHFVEVGRRTINGKS